MSTVTAGGPSIARSPLRFIAFGLAIALSVGTLTFRLAYLQIDRGSRYDQLAEQNRTVLQAIPTSRGLIFDRNGKTVVENVPSFTVRLRPSDLPLSRREEVVARLASLLGVSTTRLNMTIDGNPGSRFDYVRLAQDVPEATARLISEAGDALPGVDVTVEARRNYLVGPLLSQVLGYTAPINAAQLRQLGAEGYLPDDMIGVAGVEASYERTLRGTYGQESVEKDASGRKLKVLQTVTPAVAGSSLQLTLDTHEQELAQQALQWAMKAAGLKRGVVIVMNPQTGEVLALVSLPTYDDNLFAKGIGTSAFRKLLNDPNQPLLNHATGENFPPGSTYKLVTATGGLADKKITPTTLLDTKPYLSIGPYKYTEWNNRGWGPIDLLTAFGHSSDTYFYQVAGMLGIDRLGYWANQYGFGARTGIDLPGEVVGTVPTNQWKLDVLGTSITPGEVYQAGIGQGYDVVTPIQLITAYAALANGGKVLQPQVVRQVTGPDGNVERAFAPKLVRKLPVSQSVLKTMRLAARNVVLIRHTYNLVDMPIKVAGKSGTAEFGTRDAQGRLPFHSWFVGFVPKDPYNGTFDKPDSQLMVLAFAYDSRTVGNVATEIVKYYFQLHFGIEKDYRIPDLVVRGNFYRGN